MQDFVDSFNDHRRKFFNPGSSLTVDESFAEWNGLGGSWINIGLPMYMSLDRKPHDGCEIQDAADGDSGVLLRLIIVKSPDEVAKQQREAPKPWHDFNITHGGKVLFSLVEPWLDTGHIVVGHSAFASVRTTEMLEERNTGFLGSIKQAITGFPMKFLSTMETGGSRGGKFSLTNECHCFGQLCLTISTVTESKVLVRKTGERVDMMAVMTVDRNRQYYVATRGSSKDAFVSRERWQQGSDTTAKPTKERIEFNRPDVVSMYHRIAGKIDTQDISIDAVALL